MVLTILEAHVEQDKVALLHESFSQGILHLDAGIVQTFLLQGMKDPSQWRIMTVWQSREALDEMRHTGETPRGVLMFRAAAADPVLTVFDVVDQGVASS